MASVGSPASSPVYDYSSLSENDHSFIDDHSDCGEIDERPLIRGEKRRSILVTPTAIRSTPSTHARKYKRQEENKQTCIQSKSSTSSSFQGIASGNEDKRECRCHDVLLKMKDLERQNKTILEKLNMVLAKSTTTIATPKKLEVPAHIKSAVHDGYKCGMEERNLKWIQKDNDGKCLKYNSTPNKETTDQVVAFTKGMYPATENGVINVAVERYFESVRQRELKAAAGKAEAHRQKMMLYGRRKRKMTWRKTALKAKRSYDEDKKKKVQAAMVIDLMSSEDENDSEDDSFIIKKLPWRSEELNRIVQELDDKWVALQTPKSRKQMAKRRRMESVVSSRAPPSRLPKHIEWTVNQNLT